MPSVTINTEFSEREELCYSFILMSEIHRDKNLYTAEQLSKTVADIKKELQTELREYLDLLPLFVNRSHRLSFMTNCRRKFLSEAEDLTFTAEELIEKIITRDPDEMTARFIMTADNNAHEADFYRELVTKSTDAVKYCLDMDIDDELRTLLLAMLVDRTGFTNKCMTFVYKTLGVLRCIFGRHTRAIDNARGVFSDTDKVAQNLLGLGYIKENDTVIITPVLLNPTLIYIYDHNGIKYINLGTDYEEAAMRNASRPTVELETIGKIFADPARCEIIRILKGGGSYLSELARKLGVPTNSLHYHIQVLNENGVIKGNYKGKRFIYELNPNFFKSVSNTALVFVPSDRK